MPDLSDLVSFVATADLDRARRFYRDVLGQRHVGTDAFAAVFDCGGTMLRVTLVDRLIPVPYTVVGWRVGDLDAAMRDLVARGVTFHRYEGMPMDESGVWTTPDGARVAWFADPDGNTLSLTQFPG